MKCSTHQHGGSEKTSNNSFIADNSFLVRSKLLMFMFLFLLDGFLQVAYRFGWCNLDWEDLVVLRIISKDQTEESGCQTWV